MAVVVSPLPKRLVFDSTTTAANEFCEKRVLQAVEEISLSERKLDGHLQQEQRNVQTTIRAVQTRQTENIVGPTSKFRLSTKADVGRQLISTAMILKRTVNDNNELPLTFQQHTTPHGLHTRERTKQARKLALQRAQELADCYVTDHQDGEGLIAVTRSRKAVLQELQLASTSQKEACNEQSVAFHAKHQANAEGFKKKEEKKRKRQESQRQAAARAAGQREMQQLKESMLAVKHQKKKHKAGVDTAFARLGAFQRAALEAPHDPGQSCLLAIDTDGASVVVPLNGGGGGRLSAKCVALEQVHVQLQGPSPAVDLQQQLKDSKGRWQMLSEQLECRLSMVAKRQAAVQGSQFPVMAMSEAGVGRVALPNGMEVELEVPPTWPSSGFIRLLDVQAPTACPPLQAVLGRLKPQLQAGIERLDDFLGQVWGALREAGLA